MTPRRALVTGVAGFIGSQLAARLIGEGWSVTGVDCFTPYYEEDRKAANLAGLAAQPGFSFARADLRTAPLDPLVDGVDVVFHLAAQPGVGRSWSDGFADYNAHNVLATQRLLEVAAKRPLQRFVYASSSSVYGDDVPTPTPEDALPQPHSPYGVTKLAGEHLCVLYARNHGVAAVALRYFSVYGPRQRPDMAISRMITAAATGAEFRLYGDGQQRRDFTFVADVVDANVRAASADLPTGTVLNVASGASAAVVDVLSIVESQVGRRVLRVRRAERPGDVRQTEACIARAREMLGWAPTVTIDEGIARQVRWQLS